MTYDLRKLIGLRKEVSDTRSHAAELRARIEGGKRERDDVANAPAAKSDLKLAARRYLDEEAHDFRLLLGKKLQPLIRRPDKLARAELVARHFSAFGAPVPDDSLPSAETSDCSLLGLVGQAAWPMYEAAIDALVYDEGLPVAERAGKVAKLSAEIENLERQLAELVETARGAGIALEASA